MNDRRKFDAFSYINSTYGLAAKRGIRVEYTGGKTPQMGMITGAEGQHLLIRMDGSRNSLPFHPTWELRLLEATP